jgi:hypothetical protein
MRVVISPDYLMMRSTRSVANSQHVLGAVSRHSVITREGARVISDGEALRTGVYRRPMAFPVSDPIYLPVSLSSPSEMTRAPSRV